MSLITYIDFIDKKSDEKLLKGTDFQLHDQLTDNADWNNEFWDFNIGYLPSYAAKIESLYNQSAKGFSFSALWIGDNPTNVSNVSINEFINAIKANKIGTKTKYVISKGI